MDRPARKIIIPVDAIASRVLLPVQIFIRTESAGGVVLLVAAAIALIWANSPWGEAYFDFWHEEIALDLAFLRIEEGLQEWVTDGLMAIFFFVVGLEIKRELLHGELASPRRAALPAAAALGGMVVPALIFTAFNAGGEGARGWGIPMATDIAFAIGVLALLGRRIPSNLRVFLLALAIVDDLGAIAVVAIFYTESISFEAVAAAVGIIGLIIALQRLGLRNVFVYLLLGVCLWVAVFESGVHATVAGVILGFLTPAGGWISREGLAERLEALVADYRRAVAEEDVAETEAILGNIEDLTAGTSAPLERLERLLHPWSSFVVIPIFALANSGIALSTDVLESAATSPVTHGVALGLILGKLVGVVSATWLATRLGLASLPRGVTWNHVIGAALLAGIGFTVSLFITGLAYEDPLIIDEAKIGILAASLVAGSSGFLFLRLTSRPRAAEEPPPSAVGEIILSP